MHIAHVEVGVVRHRNTGDESEIERWGACECRAGQLS